MKACQESSGPTDVHFYIYPLKYPLLTKQNKAYKKKVKMSLKIISAVTMSDFTDFAI